MVKPGPSVAGPSASSVASAQQVEGRSTTAAAVVLSRLHADRRVSGRVLSSAWSGWAANITRKPARHVMSSDVSSDARGARSHTRPPTQRANFFHSVMIVQIGKEVDHPFIHTNARFP